MTIDPSEVTPGFKKGPYHRPVAAQLHHSQQLGDRQAWGRLSPIKRARYSPWTGMTATWVAHLSLRRRCLDRCSSLRLLLEGPLQGVSEAP